MAVHIRLARHGSKKAAFYRIVVTDNRSPRDGRFIEKLGTFNPRVEERQLEINRERLDYWCRQGAQPSHTLARLLKSQKAPAEA